MAGLLGDYLLVDALPVLYRHYQHSMQQPISDSTLLTLLSAASMSKSMPAEPGVLKLSPNQEPPWPIVA